MPAPAAARGSPCVSRAFGLWGMLGANLWILGHIPQESRALVSSGGQWDGGWSHGRAASKGMMLGRVCPETSLDFPREK